MAPSVAETPTEPTAVLETTVAPSIAESPTEPTAALEPTVATAITESPTESTVALEPTVASSIEPPTTALPTCTEPRNCVAPYTNYYWDCGCYMLVNQDLNWNEAEDKCVEYGGQLVGNVDISSSL